MGCSFMIIPANIIMKNSNFFPNHYNYSSQRCYEKLIFF